jgi:transposase-like protein
MARKSPDIGEFHKRFPDEDACLEHLMRGRFGDWLTCSKCQRQATYYRVRGRRSFECEYCGFQVYPTAGTPFERTRTPLRDWFYVIFLFCASRDGVSAKEVQRRIGVTYKTAWRMCDLIREYMYGVNDLDDVAELGRLIVSFRLSRRFQSDGHGGQEAVKSRIFSAVTEILSAMCPLPHSR